MLIRDLTPKIKALAMDRSYIKDQNVHITTAFAWINTPEGQDFWTAVNLGDWDKVYRMRPDLKELPQIANHAIRRDHPDWVYPTWEREVVHFPSPLTAAAVETTVPTAATSHITNAWGQTYSPEEKQRILNQIFS